jgi:hypothetical protein
MRKLQTPEEIYNELRERVALAFEIQAQEFIDDQKLHNITMDMYNHVVGLKQDKDISDYQINISKFNEHTYYTSITTTRVQNNEEKFLSDLLTVMNILIRTQNDPDPTKYEFEIQLNKKSITLNLLKKKAPK